MLEQYPWQTMRGELIDGRRKVNVVRSDQAEQHWEVLCTVHVEPYRSHADAEALAEQIAKDPSLLDRVMAGVVDLRPIEQRLSPLARRALLLKLQLNAVRDEIEDLVTQCRAAEMINDESIEGLSDPDDGWSLDNLDHALNGAAGQVGALFAVLTGHTPREVRASIYPEPPPRYRHAVLHASATRQAFVVHRIYNCWLKPERGLKIELCAAESKEAALGMLRAIVERLDRDWDSIRADLDQQAAQSDRYKETADDAEDD